MAYDMNMNEFDLGSTQARHGFLYTSLIVHPVEMVNKASIDRGAKMSAVPFIVIAFRELIRG